MISVVEGNGNRYPFLWLACFIELTCLDIPAHFAHLIRHPWYRISSRANHIDVLSVIERHALSGKDAPSAPLDTPHRRHFARGVEFREERVTSGLLRTHLTLHRSFDLRNVKPLITVLAISSATTTAQKKSSLKGILNKLKGIAVIIKGPQARPAGFYHQVESDCSSN